MKKEYLRKLPLLLAVALQIIPICRAVCTNPAATSTFAIIFRWTVGATATLGAFDAVSGGSQVYFDCARTAVGTVGVRFTYYITLGGTVGSDPGGVVAAAPLPAGFTNYTQHHLTTPYADWGVITGTPTSTMTNILINLAAAHPEFNGGVPVTGSLRLTVYPTSTPVVITTQPTNLIATHNQSVSFTVAATGTGPLTYQWYKGDTNIWNHIPDATNAMYTFNASTNKSPDSFAVNSGNYLVRISGAAGMLPSASATLIVNSPLLAITAPPTNLTVNVGDTASFYVTANGTSPLSYQWYKNFTTRIAGATTSNYNIGNVQLINAGNFTVVVTNAAGALTSSIAALTVVSNAAVAPSITTPPTNLTVVAGQPASFSVVASGTAPLNYQWQLNEGDISGATNATLALAGVTTDQAGSYVALVNNSAGSVTSSPAILTVLVPPAITTQPTNQTVTAGGSATFEVTATGTAPLSYQWQLNEGDISGATNATLALTGVTADQAGSYVALVNNSAGSVTSSPAILTVLVPPLITTQPTNQTVTAGGSATFEVTATGTAPLSYQWQLNEGDISGATNATLALTGVTADQAGSYVVLINNSAGSVTSSPAILTVLVPPAITTQPTNQTATAGGSAAFDVTATGTAPLSYQWTKDSTNIPGATNSSWSLANARTTDAGIYSVVVTNSAGSITSSNAQLTVTIPSAPAFSSLAHHGNNFIFTFTPVVGLTNSVLTNGTVGGSGWSVLTNIPPPVTATSITVTDVISGRLKFYRVSVSP